MASGDDSPIFEDDESLENMTDLVAVWKVALSDRVHKIEFEHGTASGKRVVYVNGKKVLRKEWMFSLIGKETFCIGASKIKATINIKPRCASSYDYTLEINGKSLKEYMESRKKTTNTWILHLNSKDFRVVLECLKAVGNLRFIRKRGIFLRFKTSADQNNQSPEKDTMDVWCNGKKMKTVAEFVDDGSENHFKIMSHDCYIKTVRSSKQNQGIIHSLIVGNREIPQIF